MLDEREAFLRAIFDSPDDDTPRLVYADWLEEHDFPDHAGLIRIQCELSKRKPGDNPMPEHYQRQAQLLRAVNLHDRPAVTSAFPNRGFRFAEDVLLTDNELADPVALRERAATLRPEWFGARRIVVTHGPILTEEQIASLFELPCFERVTELDLTGRTLFLSFRPTEPSNVVEALQQAEFRYEPAIGLPGLNRLVQHRGVRRLKRLLCHSNDLDNDAIGVLLRSPYLDRLEELGLSRGNRFRGRVWQQLIERFGEEVVS